MLIKIRAAVAKKLVSSWWVCVDCIFSPLQFNCIKLGKSVCSFDDSLIFLSIPLWQVSDILCYGVTASGIFLPDWHTSKDWDILATTAIGMGSNCTLITVTISLLEEYIPNFMFSNAWFSYSSLDNSGWEGTVMEELWW